MTDPRPTQMAASPLSEERVREYETNASVERMATIWRLWADQNEPTTDAERAAVSFARHIKTLTQCCGRIHLTDSCYGMTGGRRYDCEKCGSYVVVNSPDSHPEFCTAPLADRTALSARVAELERDKARLDAIERGEIEIECMGTTTRYFNVYASVAGNFHTTADGTPLRQILDTAIADAQQLAASR